MSTESYNRLSLAEGQIRLLLLGGGFGPGEVNCDLLNVSLKDCPEYEALSYVWGDSNDMRLIYLCGEPHHVTANLESALRNLRYNEGCRILWVDAVCINQQDIPELNLQVSQMDRIYKQAKQVLVWLGEGSPELYLAMDAIEDAGNEERHCSACVYPLVDSLNATRGRIRQDCLSALETLLSLPWWKRVWTLQEFVLSHATKFCCGNRVLLEDCMLNLLTLLDRPNGLTLDKSGSAIGTDLNYVWTMVIFKSQRKAVLQRRELFEKLSVAESASKEVVKLQELVEGNGKDIGPLSKQDALGLEELKAQQRHLIAYHQRIYDNFERRLRTSLASAIEETKIAVEEDQNYLLEHMRFQSYRQCLNPRDKVYGFLSLLSASSAPLMVPNYALPIPVVYRDLAIQIIRQNKNLHIFSLSFLWRSPPEFVTWAPDWRAYTTPQIDYTIRSRYKTLRRFHTSREILGNVNLVSDRALSLRGSVVDVVGRIASPAMTKRNDWQYRQSSLWRNLAKHSQQSYINAQQWEDAFCHTLLSCAPDLCDGSSQIPDWIKYILLLEGRSEDQSDSTSFQEGLRVQVGSPPLSTVDQGQIREIRTCVGQATHMRRFIISNNGYMGLVPIDTQPGDKICILYGGRVPFILRETYEQVEVNGIIHNCHILLGDSYIHGLMKGEATEMVQKQEIKEQGFYLV